MSGEPRNPAEVLLDMLRQLGWKEEEIDHDSFKRAADYCEKPDDDG